MEDPTNDTLAIVATTTSVVVAALSMLTAVLTRRSARRTIRELAVLKHDLQLASEREKFLYSQQTAAVTSLMEASRFIQGAKDVLGDVARSRASELDSSEIIRQLKATSEGYVAKYREDHPFFGAAEAAILHEGKHVLYDALQHFRTSPEWTRPRMGIPPSTRRMIRKWRHQLDELQAKLRDVREHRLMHMLQEFGHGHT